MEPIEVGKLDQILNKLDSMGISIDDVTSIGEDLQSSIEYLRLNLVDYSINNAKVAAASKSYSKELGWTTVLNVTGKGLLFSSLVSTNGKGYASIRLTIDGGVTILNTVKDDTTNAKVTGLYTTPSLVGGKIHSSGISNNSVSDLSSPALSATAESLKAGLGTKTGHVFLEEPLLFNNSLKVEMYASTDNWSGTYTAKSSASYKLLD